MNGLAEEEKCACTAGSSEDGASVIANVVAVELEQCAPTPGI